MKPTKAKTPKAPKVTKAKKGMKPAEPNVKTPAVKKGKTGC